jgi:secernin
MSGLTYFGPATTTDSSSWLAKNSLRNPREALATTIVPRESSGGSAVLERGFGYAIAVPEGGSSVELGINERGVAIGTHAVASKHPTSKEGLRNDELVRGVLAGSVDAKAAVEAICAAIEGGEQAGIPLRRGGRGLSCSFMVSDPREAYLVETAGRKWAWKPIVDAVGISGSYSIDLDYKRLDAGTRKQISPVNERAACSDEADPGRKGNKESWRELVEARHGFSFSRRRAPKAQGEDFAATAAGRIDATSLFGFLRSHGKADGPAVGRLGAGACEHGGFARRAVTGSFALRFPQKAGSGLLAILWLTGTPYPCLSLFKPILLLDSGFLPLWTTYPFGEMEAGFAYWRDRSDQLRRRKAWRRSEDPEFIAGRDSLQTRILRSLATALEGEIARARTEIDLVVDEWDRSLRKPE